MSIKEDFKQLRNAHARMTTILNELEVLEDGVDVDYSEVITDYKWLCNMLEHRRTTLQKRGRTL